MLFYELLYFPVILFAKIGNNAIVEAFRFANIDDGALRVLKDVDAG